MTSNSTGLGYVGLSRPTVFAHRGASAYAPENTLAAFQLAIEQGVDAIELDVQLTLDGQVVVIHDRTVDRTTNGAGLVKHLKLAELQRLDAGSHFEASFKGERVPTLAEVFAAVGNQIFIDVELKNLTTPSDILPDLVVNLVRAYHLERSILISSFSPIALLRTHRLMREVPIGLLIRKGSKGVLSSAWLGRLIPHQAIHPAWMDVTPMIVKRNHHLGYRVHPYTINDPLVMQNLFNMGVDGIFTNDPQVAIKVIREMREG